MPVGMPASTPESLRRNETSPERWNRRRAPGGPSVYLNGSQSPIPIFAASHLTVSAYRIVTSRAMRRREMKGC